MSRPVLVELHQAAPERGMTALTLAIGPGLSCLMAGDELLAHRYLRMMAGVEPSAQGQVRVTGVISRGALYQEQALRRRVGYVTPQAPLLSVLDGVRNVMLPALYHGIAGEEEAARRAMQLIDEMDYGGDPRRLPAFMPELQRRMLLIARALILEPELLFIEQPLQGLARADCDRLCDYICGAVTRRVTALVISGNDPLLASVAGQVVFVGQQEALVFDGWHALLTARQQEIMAFLERERRSCRVLQG